MTSTDQSKAARGHEAYRRAVEFLNGLQVFGARFGLETARQLAASVGNPQEKLRFIHVAGTNGKGSTCAMLESIYRAAGLRVGLFTSPHLVSFRERIQINRHLISEADVVRLVDELRAATERRSPNRLGFDQQRADSEIGVPPGVQASPTLFEFTTVMALRYFAEQKCELVIWETGLGGRLDATNIVTPLASVITNIGLDHQQWLGDTLEKIAAEKTGIIKSGVPVVTTANQPEVLPVIERIAREQNAPLTKVWREQPGVFSLSSPEGGEGRGEEAQLCSVQIPSPQPSPRSGGEREPESLSPLPLPGEHQRLNAALALATVEVLQSKIPVTEKAIHAGLTKVNWPGRMQLVTLPSGQRILLDGAHNPDGAETLRAALRTGAPVSAPARPVGLLKHAGSETGAPLALILGILGDKNCRAMCDILAPLAARVLVVPVKSERTAAPDELAEFCRTANPAASVASCASLSEALERVADEAFVVIAGSLYLIGEAMELLHLSAAPEQDEKSLNEWTQKRQGS